MENNFWKRVAVSVPHKSAHSLNHFSAGTGTTGTLIPFLCKEIIAGSEINLTAALQSSLFPTATDPFMKTSVNLEVFFVPLRLCQKSNAKWFTAEPNAANKYAQRDLIGFNGNSDWTSTALTKIFGAGSLADYLGYKFTGAQINEMYTSGTYPTISPDKFIAYHLLWDTFYRNSKVQRSCFDDSLPASTSDFNSNVCKFLPYNASYANSPYKVKSNATTGPTDSKIILNDNVSLFELRQRNWDLDYFTSSMLAPQQGNAQYVRFDTSQAEGDFTISALRAANSMQIWAERNGLIGYDYCDWLFGHWGVAPKQGMTNKPLYLGRSILDLRCKGIYQTSSSSETNSINKSNPWARLSGASSGRAYGDGVGKLLKHFVADEPGYLFVLGSLVPRVTYSTGVVRENYHYIADGSVSDMAFPLLQNTGNQPIYKGELDGRSFPAGYSGAPFSYSDKYAEFMTEVDHLHGYLRDGEELSAFALQRSLGNPTLNSAFLQIPKNYLDQIMIQNTNGSLFLDVNASYWYDIYFDFKVRHPLHAYSLPSLQDPSYEHGKIISVSRTGQKLG